MTSLIKEIIEKKRYSFHEAFDSWEDAIRAACIPLVSDGSIEDFYPDEIIANVHKFGPYIVIAPDVCIPHAQEGNGVNATAICFMKTERPVDFGPEAEYDATIFFVLASTDNNEHMKNLVALVELLEDEEKFEILKGSKKIEDLYPLIKE